jgi:hypothetical protein
MEIQRMKNLRAHLLLEGLLFLDYSKHKIVVPRDIVKPLQSAGMQGSGEFGTVFHMGMADIEYLFKNDDLVYKGGGTPLYKFGFITAYCIF